MISGGNVANTVLSAPSVANDNKNIVYKTLRNDILFSAVR